jgi:hypothetical protein
MFTKDKTSPTPRRLHPAFALSPSVLGLGGDKGEGSSLSLLTDRSMLPSPSPSGSRFPFWCWCLWWRLRCLLAEVGEADGRWALVSVSFQVSAAGSASLKNAPESDDGGLLATALLPFPLIEPFEGDCRFKLPLLLLLLGCRGGVRGGLGDVVVSAVVAELLPQNMLNTPVLTDGGAVSGGGGGGGVGSEDKSFHCFPDASAAAIALAILARSIGLLGCGLALCELLDSSFCIQDPECLTAEAIPLVGVCNSADAMVSGGGGGDRVSSGMALGGVIGRIGGASARRVTLLGVSDEGRLSLLRFFFDSAWIIALTRTLWHCSSASLDVLAFSPS